MAEVFRGTREELRALLAAIPATLAGRRTDAAAVVRGLQLRIGVALLSQVQQDFLAKARGGTGRDGIKWEPLKPATIARRRRSPGDKKAAKAATKAAVAAGGKRPTVLQLFGARGVEIGRDTGRMFRSLSPGVEDRPAGVPDQVFDVRPGTVAVGTTVPYAMPFHRGRPANNQPARPLWPLDGTIPPAWWPAILAAAQRGLAVAIARIVGRR